MVCKSKFLKECELIGAIIGDGHIHTLNCKYVVGFTGHPVKDWSYFLYLQKLISEVWGLKPRVYVRSNGVRMRFNSKSVVKRLINYFELPCNKGKCLSVRIPRKIICDWWGVKEVIKGIFDTDGSVFTSNKPGASNYPSIEITASSKQLAFQLKKILERKGFKLAKVRNYKSKNSRNTTYKVPLYGFKNLEKWFAEIGSSNPTKHNKFNEIL